jgi:hypothetical protein
LFYTIFRVEKSKQGAIIKAQRRKPNKNGKLLKRLRNPERDECK